MDPESPRGAGILSPQPLGPHGDSHTAAPACPVAACVVLDPSNSCLSRGPPAPPSPAASLRARGWMLHCPWHSFPWFTPTPCGTAISYHTWAFPVGSQK